MSNEPNPALDRETLHFTVFIPTYNRRHTLGRALDSVAAQTLRDIELIVVDDGSTDNTDDLVKDWEQGIDFPVYYIWQENAGKHAAHNTAVRHARGELFVVLDSDDAFVPDALEKLWNHWLSISNDERNRFSGVEGLTAFFDGTISGTCFPQNILDSDYITLRRECKIRGDKKGAIRTDLLKSAPYPVYTGERHMRDSWLWRRLATKYRTRYVNEVIQYTEHQPGGLSSDPFRLRMANPRGFRHYFLEDVNHYTQDDFFRNRVRACIAYIRYSFHAGIGPLGQLRDLKPRWLWFLAFFPGMTKWLSDRLRLRAIQRHGDSA